MSTERFLLVLLIGFLLIKATKKVTKKAADRVISVEYNWIVIPLTVTALLLISIASRNNWFIGTKMPFEFKNDMTEYIIIVITMLFVTVIRFIKAFRIEKLLSPDLDDEDRKNIKLIRFSVVIWLVCAFLLYFSAYYIVPFIWSKK
jgi:hypothetical protein